MFRSSTHFTTNIDQFTLSPVMVQLYVPPINWRGDPQGHIGVSDTFFFVLSGECCLMIENEPFILRKGDLAFLPKNKMRAYSTFGKDLTMYEINFSAEINNQNWYDVLDFKNSNYVVNTKDIDKISELFEDSLRYEMNKDIFYDLISCTNLSAIIKEYITLRYAQEKLMTPFADIIKLMKENIEKNIKLDEMAKAAFMQPTYFIKKFNDAYGLPPVAYFNKLKIYHSMTLLTRTQLPICDVAKKIGITDTSYFARMFKKHCELTPREYRALFAH